jgi:hypothetical protein
MFRTCPAGRRYPALERLPRTEHADAGIGRTQPLVRSKRLHRDPMDVDGLERFRVLGA